MTVWPTRRRAFAGGVLLALLAALLLLNRPLSDGEPIGGDVQGSSGSVSAPTPPTRAEPGDQGLLRSEQEGAASASATGTLVLARPSLFDRTELGGVLHERGDDDSGQEFVLPVGVSSLRLALSPGTWVVETRTPHWIEPPVVQVVPGRTSYVALRPWRPITYRVVEDGHPLPGTQVVVVDEAGSWRWEGTCDANGLFTVPTLPHGGAQAVLTDATGRVQASWLEAPDAPGLPPLDVPFDIVLEPVELRFLDAGTRAPIQGVQLAPEVLPSFVLAASASDGRVQVPARSESLGVLLARHPDYETADVATERGGDVLLHSLVRVRYRLVAPDGAPIAGARVQVLPHPSRWSVKGSPPSLDGWPDEVVSDREGIVRVSLPTGRGPVLLAALHEAGWWGILEPDLPRDPSAAAPGRWVLERTPPLHVVPEGGVLDGEPLMATSFAGRTEPLPPKDDGYVVANPLSVRLLLVPTTSGGRVTVARATRDDSPWSFARNDGVTRITGRLHVPNEPGHEVEVRLRYADGRPVVGWLVELQTFGIRRSVDNFQRWPESQGARPLDLAGWEIPPAGGLERITATDAEGRARFVGIPPEDYHVLLSSPDDPSPGFPEGMMGWDLGLTVPEERSLDLTLPPFRELVLDVRDEDDDLVEEPFLEVTRTDFLRAGEVWRLSGGRGRILQWVAFPEGTRVRIVAVGYLPADVVVPRDPSVFADVFRSEVVLHRAEPMRLVLDDGEAGQGFRGSVRFLRPNPNGSEGEVLDRRDLVLEPDVAFELDAPFPGCEVRLVPARGTPGVSPDRFVFAPGQEVVLRQDESGRPR